MRHIWLQVYTVSRTQGDDHATSVKQADAAIAKCKKLND